LTSARYSGSWWKTTSSLSGCEYGAKSNVSEEELKVKIWTYLFDGDSLSFSDDSG